MILVGSPAGVRGVDMAGDEVELSGLDLSGWYGGSSPSSVDGSDYALQLYLDLRVPQGEFIQSASSIDTVVMTRFGRSRRVKWEVRISRYQPIEVRQSNGGAWVRVKRQGLR